MFQHFAFSSSPWSPGWPSPSPFAATTKRPGPRGCAAAVDDYFEDEVWAKVGRPEVPDVPQARAATPRTASSSCIDPRKSAGARPATRRCGTTATPSPGWPA